MHQQANKIVASGQRTFNLERLYTDQTDQTAYFTNHATEISKIDNWYEEDIRIESWMIEPFDSSVVEEELNLEPWMTKPFASTEIIWVREWML